MSKQLARNKMPGRGAQIEFADTGYRPASCHAMNLPLWKTNPQVSMRLEALRIYRNAILEQEIWLLV